MKKQDKTVAYVGTYTYDGSSGLYVYDVKKDGQLLVKRESIDIANPSYMVVSHDGEILYTVVDEGLTAFKIDEKGDLTYMNTKPVGGMRGCFLDIDSKRRYVFMAGYHDGHVVMMKIKKDGSLSGVADSVFHLGHALSATERRLDHPKVSCVRLTPDEKYLCASDFGLNQIRVYKIDYDKGRLEQVETVRCALDGGPRTICFSSDNKFCYILTGGANCIEIYSYDGTGEEPVFELIDREDVLTEDHVAAASTHMIMSEDEKHIFVSIDGVNYVSWFDRDRKKGTLKHARTSPVSGDYPKFISMLPGTDELIVLNHDSHEIRDFRVNYKENYMLQCERPARVETPNCICFHKLGGR